MWWDYGHHNRIDGAAAARLPIVLFPPHGTAQVTADSTKHFTSARIVTAGRHSFLWDGPQGASRPIRISARIKAPMGECARGVWAARGRGSPPSPTGRYPDIDTSSSCPMLTWGHNEFNPCVSDWAAQGLWPAFWMLPEPNHLGGWCSSGEVRVACSQEVLGSVFEYRETRLVSAKSSCRVS